MNAGPDNPPRSTFLGSLPDADKAELMAAGHPRSWERGELLVRVGDPADAVFLLLEGLVKVHVSSPDGGEVILGLCGPGDLLGEAAIHRSARRSATVTALESVRGVALPTSSIRSFLRNHPGAALHLLDMTLDRLYVADTSRLELATAESLTRVVSRLVELCERFGSPVADGGIEVGLPMSQEELASWSGASRESTARALRTLRELGLVETHRLRLVVTDLLRLRGHLPRR